MKRSMTRRLIGVTLIALAACLAILTPMLAFTPVGAHLFNQWTQGAFTMTPIPLSQLTFLSLPKPSSGLCEQQADGDIPPLPIPAARGKPPNVSATAAYLLDTDTDLTLADVNGEEPLPMASTTKIMTAVIAIETADLDQLVPIHQDAIDEVTQNQGSSAQLVVGDKIPLRYLLYGLLLPSGDDAAVAIADAVGGTTRHFVSIMNLFAYRLHLFETHYANPDGLPASDHHTSAYDLARLARCAMTLPFFAQIVQTPQYVLPANGLHHRYTWKTTNQLLSQYVGATGIKTGTTPEAGFCLVFSAMRNGRHLIGVVLHSTGEARRFADARGLLDWGFGLLRVASG